MNSGPKSWFSREGLALLTDLYELTMMAGYWKEGRTEQQASFDYFFRSLPPHAGFAVMAGLEPLLDYLEHLRSRKTMSNTCARYNSLMNASSRFFASFAPDSM